MTKADRIRELYAQGGLTVKQIAALIGCRPEYVRVCARQRKDGAPSVSDAAYHAKTYARGDRKAARDAFREVYHANRSAGRSSREARNHASCAYRDTMRSTGKAASHG